MISVSSGHETFSKLHPALCDSDQQRKLMINGTKAIWSPWRIFSHNISLCDVQGEISDYIWVDGYSP